jgi:hypothetical protein
MRTFSMGLYVGLVPDGYVPAKSSYKVRGAGKRPVRLQPP